jgi:hypothetical protein
MQASSKLLLPEVFVERTDSGADIDKLLGMRMGRSRDDNETATSRTQEE